MPAASTDAVFVGVDTHADTHHRSCRRPTRRPPRRPRVPRGSDRLPQPPGLDLLNRISHRRGSGRHRNLRSPLGRVLTAAGLAVLEVNRPDRATRRINGKSDPVDAYAAAQAVVSGRADSVPKSRDGDCGVHPLSAGGSAIGNQGKDPVHQPDSRTADYRAPGLA